ncbi:class I SAM-dependent methyltransferase [Roseococcus sp. SDR]|uniref:class I SAM-dependent methyltransferase n=1 Tax=Roseococcus sp. SDR TaxID=2835532 RepID=UPI001BCE7EF2|nr:class I SAM-dependent methyltransferase [Roseococcus sp. SDR]MBS7788492.1 class I SAM-dependent methyltransferase [Roseococcus sp. SDR]MBV1843806.1 class I SAM-dependent methyltransferase [Roseococcus sp. SDR]
MKAVLVARRDRTLQDRFARFYRGNRWGDPETRSGPGSRLDSGQVRDAIEALRGTVEGHEVRSLADIPCGDFNWMPLFLESVPGLAYLGFDIVPEIIADNRARHPGRRFERLDITREVPPRVDLIFCKDLLNHFCFADVAAALVNMRRSGSRLLLASNNVGHPNVEMPRFGVRQSRHRDIMLPPFGAPEPIWRTHYLGLWRLADFPREVSVIPQR